VETPRERALAYLYSQIYRDRQFRGDEGTAGREARARAAVRALRAAGLLSDPEAAQWEARLAGERQPPPAVSGSQGEPAAELLEELLASIPPGDDGMAPETNRFEGALHALVEVHALDADEWDGRLREGVGRPSADEEWEATLEANAGGTQQELLAVLGGPGEGVDGVRVLYVLRFADGIEFVIRRAKSDTDREAWWEREIELSDDVGTAYSESGGSRSDGEELIGFRTAPPEAATWVELAGAASRPIRVRL
jgi:hypothetical protein